MSVYLSDTFSGSGAPDATKWTAPAAAFQEGGALGDLLQSGGFLTITSPSSGTPNRGGEMWGLNSAPAADQYIEAVVSVTSANANADLYLGVRFIKDTNPLHGYYVLLSNHTVAGVTTGIDYTLAKRDLTGSDQFFFGVSGTLAALSGTFRVSAVGSTIELLVNGVSAGTQTDATIAGAGRPLIAMDGTYNAGPVNKFSIDSVTCDATLPSDFWTDFVKSQELA